jgi:hypothetical protein
VQLVKVRAFHYNRTAVTRIPEVSPQHEAGAASASALWEKLHSGAPVLQQIKCWFEDEAILQQHILFCLKSGERVKRLVLADKPYDSQPVLQPDIIGLWALCKVLVDLLITSHSADTPQALLCF